MLTRDDIIELLSELGIRLQARGLHGQLFVVGGAAMALGYQRERATRDVDAVFVPKTEIYDVAKAMAAERELAPDWLNDAVKGFLPGEDPARVVLMDAPGISVSIASPKYLFAMKALAARVERDADDLMTLYQLSGFTSPKEALGWVANVYPERLLTAKTRLLVEELFPND